MTFSGDQDFVPLYRKNSFIPRSDSKTFGVRPRVLLATPMIGSLLADRLKCFVVSNMVERNQSLLSSYFFGYKLRLAPTMMVAD